eukprot:COSAG04_NODE_28573_length_274_cov_2.342857_1_plen_78_part_10
MTAFSFSVHAVDQPYVINQIKWLKIHLHHFDEIQPFIFTIFDFFCKTSIKSIGFTLSEFDSVLNAFCNFNHAHFVSGS